MGAMICPSAEKARKRRSICVLMKATLQLRMAKVRMTVLMMSNLFFWYSLLSPANSSAFSMLSCVCGCVLVFYSDSRYFIIIL